MEQLQTTGGVSGPAKHSQRARKRYAPTWGVPGLGETPPCGAPAAGHAFLLPDIFVMTLKQLCLATAILPTVSCSKPVTVMAVLAQNVSAPVLPELRSRLEAAVTVDITTVLEAARAAVPALFRTTTTLDQHGVTWDGGNSDQGWLYLDNHYNPAPQDRAEFRVRAELVRDSVHYTLTGGDIWFVGNFLYRFHAQKARAFLWFWAGGYCGNNNTPTIPLTVVGHTAVAITPSWTLSAHSDLKVKDIGNCTITILGIDVAPQLTGVLRRAIDSQVLPPIAKKIDDSIAALDIRKAIELLWNRLQHPIAADAMSIELHPEGLILGDVVGSGTSTVDPPRATLTGTVGVIARPTVTTSVQQATDTPLPGPQEGAGGGAFVEASLELSYADINAALAKVAGSETSGPWGRLLIQRATVAPAGSGQIAVNVAFTGTGDNAFSGSATLVGGPVIDVLTQSVSFPTLDFTMSTDSILTNAYVWLRKTQLREQLRGALRTNWAERIRGLEKKLKNAADSAHVHLTIDQRQIEGVLFGDTMRVVVVLSGGMKIDPMVLR